MPRNLPRSGTLKSMGLRLWLDTFYYKVGGWMKFVGFMTASPRPENLDQVVADHFGRTRPRARGWRLMYKLDPTGAPQIEQEQK